MPWPSVKIQITWDCNFHNAMQTSMPRKQGISEIAAEAVEVSRGKYP